MIEATGPNAEQIRHWNEIAGPIWAAHYAKVSAQIRPFGLRAMERAAVREGERVLDVGCGAGETTLELGRRVGVRGAVLGIDISAPMLEVARRSAEAEGRSQITFENVDAQTAELPGPFDLVYSRFGVMFFADPVAAFANLRRALRPDGRLGFVCWRALGENPWMRVPMQAAAQLLPMSKPNPSAPGPFSLADEGHLRAVLEGAGFADVALGAWDHAMNMGGGGSLDETAEFLLHIGPAAAALREAQADEALRRQVFEAVRAAIAPFEKEGGVYMPGAVWVVTARNP